LLRPFGISHNTAISISSAIMGVTLAVILSSCTLLDKTAQDKAACDKLSEMILNESGYQGSTENEYYSLIANLGLSGSLKQTGEKIEQEVLPLASMEFGQDIDKFVRYLKKSDSTSIFDLTASYTYGADLLTQIVGHCVLVSKEN
jgi:hypothetical protein